MTVDRIFFVYMVLVGIAAGAILVAAPQVQNFAIKPYFWVLIAVGLFDGGLYLLGRTAPGQMLTMGARLAGFVFGIVMMVVIPSAESIAEFQHPIAFAIGPVRRGETVAGHIPAQHIAAGACPHADNTVLCCTAISDIFGGGSRGAEGRMIETFSRCETVSVARGSTRKSNAL